MRPPVPLVILLLAAPAPAAEEWSDPFFGVTLRMPGLEKEIGKIDFSVIASLKAPDGTHVTVRVMEAAEEVPASVWLKRARDEWEQSKRRMEGVTGGAEPHPWILFSEKRLAVFEALHLYGYFARGIQGFEVHAWVDDRAEGSEAALRRVLAAFSLAKEADGTLFVRRFAAEKSRDVDDPKVLLEAGVEYARGGKFRQVNRVLAARVLARARERMKGDALTPVERWYLLETGGSVQPDRKSAIEWYALAEEAARKVPPEDKPKERASQSAYNLACSCSLAGRLDEAFAALDRAYTEVRPVTDEHLSGDRDLENCRKDPRWDEFWRTRVKN